MAKENAKKGRAQEDAFKVLAQAQEVMAPIGLQWLRVLETQTFMNILNLPTENFDIETRDFLNYGGKNEMAELKARISPIPSPMQPTAARSSLPTIVPAHEEPSLFKIIHLPL